MPSYLNNQLGFVVSFLGMRMKVPEDVKDLAAVFSRGGFSLYLVGGAVRDYLLGRENHDYDFTTDARPEEVKALFRRTIDTGIKHGTVTVLFRKGHYEITTFRTEGAYTDSRHPDEVHFVRSLEEDLKRRDFTVNALAASLPGGEIIDLTEGRKDLRRKLIRAIGDPKERFSEDALRMMRAARFSSQLGFSVEESTKAAIKSLAPAIHKVSAERIEEELLKLAGGKAPSKGLELMRETGLLEEVLPELNATVGFRQGGIHSEDLYTHLLLSLESAREHGFPLEVRLAALFHDIGKVPARKAGEDREYTFYNHESLGADMTRAILRRLKAPNGLTDTVTHLIENHMFTYTEDWTDAAVRRFIRRVGTEYLEMLFQLRIADMEGIQSPYRPSTAMIDALSERIGKEREAQNALSLKDLKINGKDLIALGIEPGPSLGAILSKLLDEVLDDPGKNRKEYLEGEALRLSQGQGQ